MPGFSPAFDRLGAAHAAVVLQQQETLAEYLPPADWTADLQARTYTSGELTLQISMLGSYAEQERTWLWGWANPQFGPEHPAVAPTAGVRRMGARLGIPELTTFEVDLSWYDGPARHGGDLMAMAATGLLGGGGYIGAGYDGGVVYLHVDDAQIRPAGWDPVTAPRIVTSAITLFPTDHRRTVMRFLSHHQLAYQESPKIIAAPLPDGGSAVADFDERGRLVELRLIRTPAG